MAYDKAEAAEAKKQHAADVADTLLNAFKSGDFTKALAQTFLNCGGRHADGYSWRNRLLVALHGYSDAMGFGQWKKVGRSVKRGEKAFYIWVPMKFKKEDKATGETTMRTGFTTKAVFGLEQTQIIDEKKWAKHNQANEQAEKFLSELPLRAVADKWGLEVRPFDGRRSSALGWYQHGQAIGMGVENLATWAHELCHAADFRNGNLVETGQKLSSETVAEFGGAILMYCLGYETDADLGGAWEYIKGYADKAGIKTLKACMNVLERTCEAVATILQAADELASDTDVTLEPEHERLAVA